MKDKLEHSIKESLDKYEMPYDANAWSAMSKRLDQSMPINPKSNMKWYLGGAAAIAVVATTISLWPSDNTVASNTSAKVENTTETSSSTANNSNKDAVDQNSSLNEGSTTTDIKADEENSMNAIGTVENNKINELNSSTSVAQSNTYKGTTNQSTTSSTSNSNATETNSSDKKIEVRDINNICLGETTSITNSNDVSLVILDPNGAKTAIKANKSLTISPETEGKYSIGYIDNGQFISVETFNVNSAPKVDFSIDDQTKYENGLPTVNLSTNSNGSSYTWNFENQKGAVSGKDVSVHYFNKGSYSATLTVQASNGCSSSETKTIRIDEDYNLLAVTAFDPLSNDNRKNSFMPFALTQRTVDFNMIIIDPKDGSTLFESNDATNAWKGIDRRNGQMIETNKTYIWRVIIDNPVKGEKSEYKGTIIRL